MSTYRSSEERHPKVSTVETDGLVEILKRTRAIRKRVFLPTMIAAAAFGFIGAAAHVSGYWSVLDRREDGSYFVSIVTSSVAFVLPAFPFLLAHRDREAILLTVQFASLT